MSYTTQVFIEKANVKHQYKYDYTLTNYTGSKNKVTIICPIHGEFEQIAAEHLRGKGCPYCGGTKKSNIQDFIKKANKVHGNKYDYSKAVYVNNSTKLIITCPIHGDFEQTPNNHLNGQECPLCANINNPNIKITLENFISKANKIHNNKYDYSKVEYKNCKEKVCIICPEHGEFWQTPDNHTNKKQGCPICLQSLGEKFIQSLLEDRNIQYVSQYAIDIPKDIRKSGKALIDFYLPQYNTFIEYNGIQHYQYVPYLHNGDVINFTNQQKRDDYVKNYCKFNNIKFIEISYNMSDSEIITILNELIIYV